MDKVMTALRRGYGLKLVFVVMLVAFGDWLFWQRHFGIGNIGIYGLGMLAALLVVRPATIKSVPGFIATLATALYCSAIIFDAGPLSLLMFWTALCVAALLPFSSRLSDGWQWFWRLALHGVASLINPILEVTKLKKIAKRRGPRSMGLRSAFGLLALPVVGGAIFFALFVQANPVLEKLVAGWKLPAFDEVLVFRIIVWGIAALLVWSVLRPWRMKGGNTAIGSPAALVVSPALFSLASIQLSLWVFNGLFLMQNGMDLAFLSGVVPLPDTMTLASYAHRGAYPLIGTALLAGLFVMVILNPATRAASNKMVRALVVVWIAQNVVLVVSSMVRTWDYVEAYSLTQMRIAALAWMVIVGIGLGLICWRMLRAKSGAWLINANLWALGIMLTAFCFIDMGGMVAKWNVTHAREVGGKGAHLDLCYMGEMGAGAIGPLMSLEAKPLPLEFRQRVKSVRLQTQAEAESWMNSGGWTWQFANRLAAAKALEPSVSALDLGPQYRDCNGTIVDSASYPATPELTPSVTP
jgi:Domain of unknown function (DUF4173)